MNKSKLTWIGRSPRCTANDCERAVYLFTVFLITLPTISFTVIALNLSATENKPFTDRRQCRKHSRCVVGDHSFDRCNLVSRPLYLASPHRLDRSIQSRNPRYDWQPRVDRRGDRFELAGVEFRTTTLVYHASGAGFEWLIERITP